MVHLGFVREDGHTCIAQPHLHDDKRWTLADLKACDVTVESLERDGLYGRSTVEPQVWRDPDTLLAAQFRRIASYVTADPLTFMPPRTWRERTAPS